jgi:phage terminase large subunit
MTTAAAPTSSLIQIHEKFEFLLEPHRYKVSYGGRGGLKSWQFARGLLYHATIGHERILCTREVQKSLKESVHQLLSDQIEELGLSHLFEVQETVILGPHDSKFIFAGLSDLTAESIKSFERITKAWVEEARSVTKRSWNILTPTIMRVPGAEIWVTFNPELETDETYQRFVVTPPPDAVVVPVSWRDNPWHTLEMEKERLQFKRTETKEEYECVWEGKPKAVASGAVYVREVTDLVRGGRYAPCPYDPRLKVHTIWDMGWNVCSIILVQSDMRALRIIGYLEGNHVRTDEWASLLNAMPLNWGWDWIPHDAYSEERKTGMSDYQILKQAKRRVRTRENGIVEVPEEVGVRILRQNFPRIYVHKGGDELIPAMYRVDGGDERRGSLLPGLTYHNTARLMECWKRYRYAIPRQGEPQHPIADEFEHGCDATRYLALVADRLSNEDEWSRRNDSMRGAGFGVSYDSGLGAMG